MVRVSLPKAWKEMGHRYLAGVLGLMILAIAVLAWVRRGTQLALAAQRHRADGCWCRLLGKWTVTMLLKPAIVTAHLIGGMTTLALLVWLSMRQLRLQPAAAGALRRCKPAALGLVVLCAQIVLGGWVSTNYAALAIRTCRCAAVPRSRPWISPTPSMCCANSARRRRARCFRTRRSPPSTGRIACSRCWWSPCSATWAAG
jgi:cytochrome c oxidase assembly protein subunit 15